ncbi:glucoamylase family protein [Saccharicrinis sp. FJH54]|uniref:glucoamylase family protein n=1 Tax=Saccharicrinis sp. FJH54 TaxID=3344665 RepID=UPI0035D4382E
MNPFKMLKTIKYIFLVLYTVVAAHNSYAQEFTFFSDGTTTTYYDQGIVNINELGSSTFEHTYPPGAPQYNDKVPCSSLAYKGTSSMKFSYTSSPEGNWRASIFISGWGTGDISGMDSLSMYIYTETDLAATALPYIGIRTINISGSGEISSTNYKLGDYNSDLSAGKWNRISFPLSTISNDPDNNSLDFTKAKGIIFSQSEMNDASRIFYVDEITAFKSISTLPSVTNLTSHGYDSHVELNWSHTNPALKYRIFASFDNGSDWEERIETEQNYFLDFVPESARNSTIHYKLVTVSQESTSQAVFTEATIRDFSDDELLDLVERYTFRYFWEGAHQATGMALERTNGSGTTAASGATGMGLLAMIAAYEREYEPREEIKDRILLILNFLETCDRHHGAWSHWYNADTKKTQPFSAKDDGGDLVETSYVAQGLIGLRNYFSGTDSKSVQIRNKATTLFEGIEWDWYRRNDQNVLYWHWSPNYNFDMNMKVSGWNECMVTYIMAASSPTHSITKTVYDQGWAGNGSMVNPRTFYNYPIKLSPDWGGPLFFIHYSFLGINPEGLKDKYADYWQENMNTAKIHHAYAVANPLGHTNYSDKNWGLTASDDPDGYTAHRPMENDNGTISPTAALASMPYTPLESMKALKYFYRERGAELFGIYGTYDAFNDERNWVKEAYLGIDQGPIVVMIENYRSKLLWKYVMRDPDVQAGLNKLGIEYQDPTGVKENRTSERIMLYPNPGNGIINIQTAATINQKVTLKLYRNDGRLMNEQVIRISNATQVMDYSEYKSGLYILKIDDGNIVTSLKLLISE